MSSFQPARRDFLHLLSGAAGAAWLTANWPALLSAAAHAHQAAKSGNAALEVFTAEQARELDALTSRLIPTDDAPGAREAGVVYFIDHALKTFAGNALPIYQEGLKTVQDLTAQMFPGVTRFSAASEDQQNQIVAKLFALSGTKEEGPNIGPMSDNKSFIETLRVHTVIGFLIDPEGGGNRDFVGWKAIGRDPAHGFAPPFGYYDKDYPGWQAAPAETEKK